jgi:hypothetical protein
MFIDERGNSFELQYPFRGRVKKGVSTVTVMTVMWNRHDLVAL